MTPRRRPGLWGWPRRLPPLERLRPLGLALVLLLALAATLTILKPRTAPLPSAPPPGLQQTLNRFEPVRDFATAAAGAGLSRRRPQPVDIGIEVSNIYNLDLPLQTFMANGHFWLRWPQTVQTWMEQEQIEPAELVRFPNNIVSYDLHLEANSPKPRRLSGGWRQQSFAFSGHFWIETIDFQNFPFQALRIPIRLEIRPEAFALNGLRPVALLANPTQPGQLGSLIELPGLVLKGGRIDPAVQIHNGSDIQSQVVMTAFFDTHPTNSIGQWLLPILIVMVTVFVAPSVSGRLSEMRIAVPSAALLTLVVMQQSFEATIPPLSYLTFLDLIYLWCYAVTVGLFILFVWSSNQLASIGAESPDAAARTAAITAQIDRIDRRFQIGSLVGSALLVLTALLR